MLHFDSDYMEGAHPEILKRLSEINFHKYSGYGTDAICESAREKIRGACGCPEATIHFLVGGTQTNATVIRGLLRPFQGVLAPDSGHISLHEAGAVEAGGHKVIAIGNRDGKLYAGDVREYLLGFYGDENHPHMVKPGMVYISHPTEYGTLYTRQELEELSKVCREYKIPLYLDGARLSYALAAKGTDVTLKVIAENCDVFYIGGTKTGAMMGEAVVFPRFVPEDFFTIVKQSGALMAKGWMLGVQFDVLFTEGLYLECGKNGIKTAGMLREGLRNMGYSFYIDSPTNQLFVVLENRKMEELKEEVSFSFWEALDKSHTVVRFATSWATQEDEVEKLLSFL
ncbi:MAG: low specificity L-threonine aldolase [Lachnospiraceae bacterium]|nr:low specificity L-threonine aldolase [Lachnospiraceae bacterium]MDE6982790.1 low specificity L-threonine aldolase [Lachnospiraceae bacterium]